MRRSQRSRHVRRKNDFVTAEPTDKLEKIQDAIKNGAD